MKQIPSDVMIGFDMAAGGDVTCAAYFEEGKFTPVTGSEVKWPGVEVFYLDKDCAYFAPPGDFSKVDFSACQKKEIDPWVMAGIRAGASMQAFSGGWAITGFLDPNTLPSKADTSPKTAQHSKQAKPALPSLMTEAGERYQGLGWCDE